MGKPGGEAMAEEEQQGDQFKKEERCTHSLLLSCVFAQESMTSVS